MNQFICASDRVFRDPLNTRSVGTEVSAAAAAAAVQTHLQPLTAALWKVGPSRRLSLRPPSPLWTLRLALPAVTSENLTEPVNWSN